MARLTAHEASKLSSGIVKREAIVRTFETSALLRNIGIRNINGDTYTYNVEGVLPQVGFRAYNQGFQSSVGTVNQKAEVLKLLGSDADVDKRIERNHPGSRAEVERSHALAIALAAERYIMNGDATTNPAEFDGLRKRVSGNMAVPANLNNPTANSPLSLSALLKARDNVMNPTAFLMSKDMARIVSQAAHANLGGTIQIGKDDFGFRTTFFDGLPIWVVDMDDRGQRIIDFNEVGPAGGAANTSSIYIVSSGANGVTLLQNGGIMIEDLGEIHAEPILRTRIEWQLGLAVHHERAAARVWGITNAPATA